MDEQISLDVSSFPQCFKLLSALSFKKFIIQNKLPHIFLCQLHLLRFQRPTCSLRWNNAGTKKSPLPRQIAANNAHWPSVNTCYLIINTCCAVRSTWFPRIDYSAATEADVMNRNNDSPSFSLFTSKQNPEHFHYRATFTWQLNITNELL